MDRQCDRAAAFTLTRLDGTYLAIGGASKMALVAIVKDVATAEQLVASAPCDGRARPSFHGRVADRPTSVPRPPTTSTFEGRRLGRRVRSRAHRARGRAVRRRRPDRRARARRVVRRLHVPRGAVQRVEPRRRGVHQLHLRRVHLLRYPVHPLQAGRQHLRSAARSRRWWSTVAIGRSSRCPARTCARRRSPTCACGRPT